MKLTNKLLAFLWVTIGISATSCDTKPQEKQNSDTKIVGGGALSNDNPGHYSSVSIATRRYGFCTGTIVAENLIVTAAHCLDDYKASEIQILFASQKDKFNADYARQATAIDYNKSYNGDVKGGNDIGWIKFDGGLPKGYKAVPVLGNPTYMKQGTPITLVGYGYTSTDNEGQGIRLSVETKIRQYSSSGENSGMLFIGGIRGKGSCYGDSGGPAYVKFADRWFLVGATSGRDTLTVSPSQSKSCEDGYMIYSHVGYHQKWIEQSSGVKLSVFQKPEDAPIPSVDPIPVDPTPTPNPNPQPTGEFSFLISDNKVYFKNVASTVAEISLHVFGNRDPFHVSTPDGTKVNFAEPLKVDMRTITGGAKTRIRAVLIADFRVVGTADYYYDPANPNPNPGPDPGPIVNPNPNPIPNPNPDDPFPGIDDPDPVTPDPIVNPEPITPDPIVNPEPITPDPTPTPVGGFNFAINTEGYVFFSNVPTNVSRVVLYLEGRSAPVDIIISNGQSSFSSRRSHASTFDAYEEEGILRFRALLLDGNNQKVRESNFTQRWTPSFRF